MEEMLEQLLKQYIPRAVTVYSTPSCITLEGTIIFPEYFSVELIELTNVASFVIELYSNVNVLSTSSFIVIKQLAETKLPSFAIAVIVALPAETADTTPSSFTIAIDGLDDNHDKLASVAF